MGAIIRHVDSELPSLRVDSDRLAEEVDFAHREGIRSLSLITSEGGYRRSDLDFLRELPDLEELHLGACPSLTDFSGLRHVPRLRVLILDSDRRSRVDLSALTELRFLSFHYRPRITGLERLTNLESLWIWGGNETIFTPERFGCYRKVRELQINLSRLHDLHFLRDVPVELLEIHRARQAFSLAGIEQLAGSLTTLRIASSRHVADSERIAALKKLKALILTEAFLLPDCRIVQALPQLETLTLFGSSGFAEGDLSPIRDLPARLKHGYVTPKKHYRY